MVVWEEGVDLDGYGSGLVVIVGFGGWQHQVSHVACLGLLPENERYQLVDCGVVSPGVEYEDASSDRDVVVGCFGDRGGDSERDSESLSRLDRRWLDAVEADGRQFHEVLWLVRQAVVLERGAVAQDEFAALDGYSILVLLTWEEDVPECDFGGAGAGRVDGREFLFPYLEGKDWFSRDILRFSEGCLHHDGLAGVVGVAILGY